MQWMHHHMIHRIQVFHDIHSIHLRQNWLYLETDAQALAFIHRVPSSELVPVQDMSECRLYVCYSKA